MSSSEVKMAVIVARCDAWYRGVGFLGYGWVREQAGDSNRGRSTTLRPARCSAGGSTDHCRVMNGPPAVPTISVVR